MICRIIRFFSFQRGNKTVTKPVSINVEKKPVAKLTPPKKLLGFPKAEISDEDYPSKLFTVASHIRFDDYDDQLKKSIEQRIILTKDRNGKGVHFTATYCCDNLTYYMYDNGVEIAACWMNKEYKIVGVWSDIIKQNPELKQKYINITVGMAILCNASKQRIEKRKMNEQLKRLSEA